ncbi:PEPxxWA-CTERM sorting domain-containing protein [Altererythrobacter sp. SALINAS58]|uniref:PEPxxWA-CTERM sorting domain-containing protein n=1 Tax=Alteripontixanthobacter muriae TaxID=2705546 RepID=UPI001576210C|nr:PEPxxWA-CTERM sorting domain-containing protein [Alteripontixanthobacter muriae]NTZ42149.1 PEPxxWA-CTERM sorting domain-containing protein [Alteripontixanthobacter muriae]
MIKSIAALTAAVVTFAAVPVHAAVVFDEAVSGDIDVATASVDSLGQPTRTFVSLAPGTNLFSGSLSSGGGGDPSDFIPFEILAGQTATSLSVLINNSVINSGTQIFLSSTSFSNGDFFIDQPLGDFSTALPNLGPGTYGLLLGNGVVVLDYDVEFEVAGAPLAAVPEPTTWAMMLLGFGFIGGAMRSAKRRQKMAVSCA